MWQSMTGKFGADEIGQIERMPVTSLLGAILNSEPIVALRVLAELLLHEDSRLQELLLNEELNAHWREFKGDWSEDDRDGVYATRLEEEITKLKQKGE